MGDEADCRHDLIVKGKGKPIEHPICVLLDPGSEIPVLGRHIVEQLEVPCETRNKPLPIRSWNGESDAASGRMYTQPLILRHKGDQPV